MCLLDSHLGALLGWECLLHWSMTYATLILTCCQPCTYGTAASRRMLKGSHASVQDSGHAAEALGRAAGWRRGGRAAGGQAAQPQLPAPHPQRGRRPAAAAPTCPQVAHLLPRRICSSSLAGLCHPNVPSACLSDSAFLPFCGLYPDQHSTVTSGGTVHPLSLYLHAS